MKPKYIFVVGLPKTGTKLIESILEKSPGIDYKTCGETFFMGHFMHRGVRHRLKRFGDLSEVGNVRKMVDFLYSGQLKGGYWHQLSKGSSGISKETLIKQIICSNRSHKEIYQIILATHTKVTEKTTLGDKTPAHLYHIPTLLGWFPDAKIIHTFRDPRAILASEWRKRTQRVPANYLLVKQNNPLYEFMIVLHVTATWLYAVKLHRGFCKSYPRNYLMSKFEDLITNPEHSLRKLCAFLGIDFFPEMLNPRISGSSYQRSAGTGFERQAVTRWKRYLKPWMKVWMTLITKKYLREFDY